MGSLEMSGTGLNDPASGISQLVAKFELERALHRQMWGRIRVVFV